MRKHELPLLREDIMTHENSTSCLNLLDIGIRICCDSNWGKFGSALLNCLITDAQNLYVITRFLQHSLY